MNKTITVEQVAARNKELRDSGVMLTPEEQAALTPAQRAEVFAMTMHVMLRDLASGTINGQIFASTFEKLLTSQFQEAAYANPVVKAALELRNSGYDGPFMGKPIEPLFKALADLERQSQPLEEVAQAVQPILHCGHDAHDPYCKGAECKPS